MEPSFKYELPGSAVLETERLYLREINPDVWTYIFTRLTDEEIMALYALSSQKALETEKEKFRMGLTSYRYSFRLFLLQDKITGNTIGKIGYHNFAAAMNRSEIGYVMDIETEKQKGYMKEAMKYVLHFGFGELGLNRVEALLSPDNKPSRRLVEHFGFTREGLLREHYLQNGEYQDSACYALLRSEYDILKDNW